MPKIIIDIQNIWISRIFWILLTPSNPVSNAYWLVGAGEGEGKSGISLLICALLLLV